MKKTNHILLLSSCILLLSFIGCSEYERTDVEDIIHVTHKSLHLFVGDEFQITANPIGMVYDWRSEDPTIATVSNGMVTAVGPGATNIIVSKGDVYTMIPVTNVVKIPLQNVELSDKELSLVRGQTKKVVVVLTPEDANEIPKTSFSWYSENESVAMVDVEGNIKAIAKGETTVVYTKGSFVKKVTVEVTNSAPFKGPHIISAKTPLLLEVRNFDLGGEGFAYHDSDNNNQGGSNYRSENGDKNSPGVDIEGGGNIGYGKDGEWLAYTVEVEETGVYGVQLSASGTGNGFFHIKVDGEDKTGQISVPSAGGWSNWQWRPEAPAKISLTKGKHVITLFIDVAGYNFKELKFTHIE